MRLPFSLEYGRETIAPCKKVKQTEKRTKSEHLFLLFSCKESIIDEKSGFEKHFGVKIRMATWNSRGLRGSTLEDLVNRTNEKYLENGLALIQKVPTPITPINIDKDSRHITLAYFDQKSTVDYIGAVQGIPVCFDAKECAADTFALQNIHEHQVEFMGQFEKQKGIAFFLIYYSHKDLFYYLPYEMLRYFWDRAKEGGRKSFRFDELNPAYVLPKKHGILVPYLDMIQKDLEDR